VKHDYRTGKKVEITATIHALDGTKFRHPLLAHECSAPLGVIISRLIELHEQKRHQSTWWYEFWHGQFSTLEIDAEIRELTRALNSCNVIWETLNDE
jgi:hypothetical protein